MNWGIGIEASKRTHLMTTQRGIAQVIDPSLTKRFKTNDMQLRYRRMYITCYTDTMNYTIKLRTGSNAAQVQQQQLQQQQTTALGVSSRKRTKREGWSLVSTFYRK
jgi:hypothetical protein